MNNNNIKWYSVSEYADKMSKVKAYLGLSKLGGPQIVSGNVSKEWLIDNFDAICPIPTDGMNQFERDTFNYGESEKVLASTLKVGDKVYYDYNILTITEVNNTEIKTDLYDFVINPTVIVEKL